jgi:hypothetical protein
MRKGKLTIFKILIVLISILSIDGGRSILSIGNNLKFFLTRDLADDNEVPGQNNLSVFSDDENWAGIFRFDFSYFLNSPVKFLYSTEIIKQEFSDSIWQPPKSL